MGDQICVFHKAPGVPCGDPAPHIWGGMRLCCPHFDQLVEAMFEIREAIAERRHQDFVDIYESRTQKPANAEGESCRPHVVRDLPEPDKPEAPGKGRSGGETNK